VQVTGADGVHVGQDDLPVTRVREVVGPEAIVGLSTHSLDQATAAVALKPDYIGFGPLFATPTKPDYVPVGLEDIREVHARVDLPVFCIGGIKLENLETVLAAGARRVVIVSGILQASDVPGYCGECLSLLD
jgi:thiamine-phosphate pyrophosphorylase